MTKHRCTLRAS